MSSLLDLSTNTDFSLKASLLTPAAVRELEDVTAVSCGAYGSYALTGAGCVFAWGLNQFGQLGIQAEGDSAADSCFFSPRPVPSLQDKRVRSIIGGPCFASTKVLTLLVQKYKY